MVEVSYTIEIPWQTPQPPCLMWPYNCGKSSSVVEKIVYLKNFNYLALFLQFTKKIFSHFFRGKKCEQNLATRIFMCVWLFATLPLVSIFTKDEVGFSIRTWPCLQGHLLIMTVKMFQNESTEHTWWQHKRPTTDCANEFLSSRSSSPLKHQGHLSGKLVDSWFKIK